MPGSLTGQNFRRMVGWPRLDFEFAFSSTVGQAPFQNPVRVKECSPGSGRAAATPGKAVQIYLLPLRVGGADGERAGVRCASHDLGVHGEEAAVQQYLNSQIRICAPKDSENHPSQMCFSFVMYR